MRVEEIFHATHPCQACPVLGRHVLAFAQAHPVLAGGGAAESDGLQHQPLGNLLHQRPFRGVVLAAGDVQVHVAVAGVAESVGDEAVGSDFSLHGLQQLGVAGDGDCHVHDEDVVLRVVVLDHLAEGMPRLEYPVAFGPPQARPEVPAALGGADVLGGIQPLDELAGARAVELEEQGRLHGQPEFFLLVHQGDTLRPQQLERRRVEPRAFELVDRAGRRRHRWEGGHGGGILRRKTHEPQGRLEHDTEGTLGADEQVDETVARGALAGPRAEFDHLPARQGHDQAHDVVPGRAVEHRAGAAGVVGDHAAEGRPGAGVGRKEQAGVPEFFVQVLVDHPRFDVRLKILFADGEDPVHAAEIEHKPPADRDGVAFQAGTGTPAGHRDAVFVGVRKDRGHLCRRLRPDHRLGPTGRVRRLVLGMQVQDGIAGGETVGSHHGLKILELRIRQGVEVQVALLVLRNCCRATFSRGRKTL